MSGTNNTSENPSKILQQHAVAAFFLLTFAYTWSVWGVAYTLTGPDISQLWIIPGIWGPLVAGALVTRVTGGDLRAWAGQATKWRVAPRWYLIALGLPIVFGEASTVVYVFAGTSVEFRLISPQRIFGYVFSFVLVLLFAGGLEEFGWRGFALPRLQAEYTALAASVIIGAAWAAWHLPLVLMGISFGEGPPALYILWIAAAAIVLTWLYNSTGGSVLLCMLFHASNNSADLFAVRGQVSETVELLGTIADIGMWWLAALVLIGVHGIHHLSSRQGPDPVDVGSGLATKSRVSSRDR